MPINEHPSQGSIVTVHYGQGFKKPEMVKTRLAVILSPKIRARVRLCTVVPLSLTAPVPVLPFHKEIDIPFELPNYWGKATRWIKGDMINTVGFHRIDLLRMGKNKSGKRLYQTEQLPEDLFAAVRKCVLHGMGLSTLTKFL